MSRHRCDLRNICSFIFGNSLSLKCKTEYSDALINVTPILRPVFIRRVNVSHGYASRCREIQTRELEWLLNRGRHTLWGETYKMETIADYDGFKRRLPLTAYNDIRQAVGRMIEGERDILWPGVTRSFAQSSGTSDGKSKYVPITPDSFRCCHYQGGFDVVAHYLAQYPDSRIFSGKSFILGGSFANELSLRPGVKVGDLSASLIDNINPLANLVRVPSKKIALMADWSAKLPALVKASLRENVTNISGVPSWFLTVLKRVMAEAGASSIHDVWPNLEVFFHGGISFDPYRDQYRSITDTSKMHYLETYNASEGFFAVQNDKSDPAMLLLLDVGVFYEFIPIDHSGEPQPETIPAWEVEPGQTYEMVVTSCNGLWRYRIGDTVRVESVEPLKITIAGRTKHYINAFGEELMVHNAEAAMARATAMTGCEVANYTAAPVYAGDHTRGRHEWLVEFAHRPDDMGRFAAALDECLQQENSDYQAKRYKGIFLDCLTVVEARRGLFDDWLASTGKLGGQRKVPRLCNDRRFIDPMLALNT